jgi:hypothetical protein
VAERARRAGATVTGLDLLKSQPDKADEIKAAFVANAELDRDGDRFRQERSYLLIRGTRR